jgi:hypothetical protein
MFFDLDEIGVSNGVCFFLRARACLLVGTPAKRTRIIQVERLKAAVQLNTMHAIVQNKSPNANIITFVWLDQSRCRGSSEQLLGKIEISGVHGQCGIRPDFTRKPRPSGEYLLRGFVHAEESAGSFPCATHVPALNRC